jgi:hypothetical protein
MSRRSANDLKRDAQSVAIHACRPRSEESQYPGQLNELGDVLAHLSAAPAGYPGGDAARRIMAQAIPRGELTPAYSIIPGERR